MPDPRVAAVARILVDYSTDVQPGQFVVIRGKTEATPMLLAVYERALARGAHPWLQPSLGQADELFFSSANDAQLNYISPLTNTFVESVDVVINVLAESNTKALSGVDPAKQAAHTKAQKPIMKRFMERSAQGELVWALGLYPTDAFAQDAEMSLRDYENFVYDACLVGEPDPVAAWQHVSEAQQSIVDALSGKREVRVVAPDTDLTLSVEGRRWVKADGRMNLPDGEVFTGPQEQSVNGHIRFTFPACLRGREVEDVRLWFEQGKVVKASARKNEAFLNEMLEADEGARYLGEFAIGTNSSIQQFTKNILFDEKIGGTVHMAIGAGYPETGSKNVSAIHWDMICDLRKEGALYVDGEKFVEAGKVLV